MEKKIQNYWNNRAETYSESINKELNSFKKDAWKNIIKNKVGDKQKIKVLDVGTGPGFLAIIMSQLGYEVTAIDFSENMIKEAKSNAKVAGVDIEFLKGNVDNLNLKEESFDLIISRNVTWTLKEPVKAYKNWYNLLKKDGKLLIFDASWYLRIAKTEIQEQHEKDIILAESMGYNKKVTNKQSKECENIAKDLPLTYKQRPEWDGEILSKCGFQNIIIEKDISELIYTEEEKIAYRANPTFCIFVCK